MEYSWLAMLVTFELARPRAALYGTTALPSAVAGAGAGSGAAQEEEHREGEGEQPPLGVGDRGGERVLPGEGLGGDAGGGEGEGRGGGGGGGEEGDGEDEGAGPRAEGAEDPGDHAAEQEVLGEHGEEGVATGHRRAPARS